MIYVALFRGRGLISSLIRWQTRGTYSHAAIVIGQYPLTIIESWQGVGVRKKVLHDSIEVDFFTILAPIDVPVVLAFLNLQLGMPYDYISVLRFVSRRKPLCPEKWFCSELVHEALRAGGVSLLNRDSEEVGPDHLAWSPLLKKIKKEELFSRA